MPNAERAQGKFKDLKARPGMFIPGGATFEKLTIYLCGMDYAYDGEFLKGFDDWVKAKFRKTSPQYWGVIVEDKFKKLPEKERTKYNGDITLFLFALVDEFLEQRDA